MTSSPNTTDVEDLNNTISDGPLYDDLGIIYVFSELLLGVIMVAGNGLVLVVLARERQLQTVTNYFVASLAMADFLVGILGIPCAIASFSGIPSDFYGCLVMNTIIVLFTQISIFGLLAVAVERFIAVRFPFRYKEHFDGRVAVIVIVISWVGALVVGLVPLAGWHPPAVPLPSGCMFTAVIDMSYMVYFNFLACVLAPLFLVLVFYVAIFQAVRRQLKQIDALEVHAPPPDGAASQGQRHRLFFKELRVAKWLGGVVALFAACWLPIHVCNTVTLLAGKTNGITVITSIILSHANSAVNPILYAYSNTTFKRAIHNTLCCRRHGDNDNGYDRTTAISSVAGQQNEQRIAHIDVKKQCTIE